jgi:Ca2+-binding EF-hand superfamily protein
VISDTHLKALKRAFEHYDSDNDGYITKNDQFPRALKSVGIIPTAEELQGMCDTDKRLKINLIAFISIVYHYLKSSDTEEELEKAFRGFAKDPKKEILPVDTAKEILLNLQHPLPVGQVEDLLQKLGRSGVIRITDMVKEILSK